MGRRRLSICEYCGHVSTGKGINRKIVSAGWLFLKSSSTHSLPSWLGLNRGTHQDLAKIGDLGGTCVPVVAECQRNWWFDYYVCSSTKYILYLYSSKL